MSDTVRRGLGIWERTPEYRAKRKAAMNDPAVRAKMKAAAARTWADPAVRAQGTHLAEVRAFLVKYYGTAVGQKVDEPLHTATAKARLGLVTVHGEDYQIVDIGMRMLQPRELYRAQGFPDGYNIEPAYKGKRLTKTAQVRMCGNSVCPPIARALVEANV
jgi:DNA (cytosine-5)-methyltransferase 1